MNLRNVVDNARRWRLFPRNSFGVPSERQRRDEGASAMSGEATRDDGASKRATSVGLFGGGVIA